MFIIMSYALYLMFIQKYGHQLIDFYQSQIFVQRQILVAQFIPN